MPGKCDDDGGVESADVDAQLEGVGSNHAGQFASEEFPFDLASLGRRVTGPIGRNGRLQLVRQAIDDRLVDQLGRLAAAGEHDGPEPFCDESGRDLARPGQGRPSPARLLVDQGRIPERGRAFACWRIVPIDDLEVEAGE